MKKTFRSHLPSFSTLLCVSCCVEKHSAGTRTFFNATGHALPPTPLSP